MYFGQWLGLLALVIPLYIIWQIRQIVLIVFAAIAVSTFSTFGDQKSGITITSSHIISCSDFW